MGYSKSDSTKKGKAVALRNFKRLFYKHISENAELMADDLAKQLADRLECKTYKITYWINGNGCFTFRDAQILAEFFGVQMEEFGE